MNEYGNIAAVACLTSYDMFRKDVILLQCIKMCKLFIHVNTFQSCQDMAMMFRNLKPILHGVCKVYEGGSESSVIGVITLLIDIIGCCIIP